MRPSVVATLTSSVQEQDSGQRLAWRITRRHKHNVLVIASFVFEDLLNKTTLAVIGGIDAHRDR